MAMHPSPARVIPAIALLEDDDPDHLRARAQSMSGAGRQHSRSYRDPYALVVWYSGRVGVDLERIEADSGSLDFARSICTPDELDRFGPMLTDAAFVASLWSSKEAISKALGDAVRYDPRRLDAPALWSGGVAGRWRAARVPVPDEHVGWLVWERPE